MSSGKRTNLERSEYLRDWWVGSRKDEGYQFEGSWAAMAYLAAKILSDPATEIVVPNLSCPDLAEAMSDEQRKNRTGEPHVKWAGRSS